MNCRRLVLTLTLLCSAVSASACPVWDSATGKEVRAGIFGNDFARNLLAVVLPFAAVAGVAAAVHFGLPLRGRSNGQHTGEHDAR